MKEGALDVAVGPDLRFRFEGLPPELRGAVAESLAWYLRRGETTPGSAEAFVFATTPSAPESGGRILVEEPPLTVRGQAGLVRFELPGLLAWCEPERRRGWIVIDRDGKPPIGDFVHRVLPPLLAEMAAAAGWLGIHAAAVEVDGVGFLLPAPSGSGKSTIFAAAHQAGHRVLSDDFVWVVERSGGFRMVPYPRQPPCSTASWPTVPEAWISAVVRPAILGSGPGRLVVLPAGETLSTLIAETGFLGAGERVGASFRSLVRLTRSVPSYRLEAGPDRSRAPLLLAELAADLRDEPVVDRSARVLGVSRRAGSAAGGAPEDRAAR